MATKIIRRNADGDLISVNPITREVETRTGRLLIVTLGESGITFREKGRRKRFGPLEYGSLYQDAVSRTLGVNVKPRKPKQRPSR